MTSSLNATPSGERTHIGIFGRTNAGKSSLINAITGQNHAIVSPVAGTTTDPVSKTMELLPLGPVVIIDTPGLDDDSELGLLRTQKTQSTLSHTDIALVVVDITVGVTSFEVSLFSQLKEQAIPYIIVFNKSDMVPKGHPISGLNLIPKDVSSILVSSVNKDKILDLKNLIARLLPENTPAKPIISDLVKKGDFVVLVVPIDDAAPKGRLILPQQQTIRELLESGAASIVVKETELKDTLDNMGKKPDMVVTDSQAFKYVSEIVPEDISLTSFSILMARHKGNLRAAVEGAHMLDGISSSDTIVISEGCTHHRQCGDIGTEKLPALIRKYSGANPKFIFTSGNEFCSNDVLRDIKLIIHCGGCMLNDKEMMHRYNKAKSNGIPITNYGIAIAHMNGILNRTTEIFKGIYD